MALHLGFDMASNPEWREAMSMCRDSGQQVATRPMIDEQGSAQSTILVFAPIYSDGVVPATVTDRRQSLNGFILSVFHVDNIVRAAFPRKQMKEIGLTIVDTSMAPDELLVYAGTKDASPHKKSEVARMLNRDLKSSASIQVAGRQWLCRFAPTPDFYIGEANRHNWLILASGVSLTALLGAFLLLLSGRTARIEASESRYLDLYDNAPDMFISIDMSTQRVIQCNQTLLEVTGFSKEDVIGTHYYDLFDRNSRADVRRAFQMFLDKGQAKEVELRLFCADGQFVDTSINVSAVRNEQGESIYCRATLRDITSKKRIERQIKEQELELAHVARLSMMGEMATGLAHEINQPLAAIAAYAEGAAIRIRNGSSDADGLARVVDRISADAHRAGEVIRRLRRFVRKREPERREVDMNELIREVAQFVGPDLKHRQAKLELDLEECLLPLRVDAVQIQQVLVNLVRNGCDAMEETQPAQRLLTIRSRANGQSSIDVDVEDYGHGVSESMDEQVFEPFFSAKKDGLGMGLAISRSIIELHGGQIWVTPNLQEGATFHFSLPATDKIPQDDRSSNSISG
jgi:PAS domain S-box-containing protein